MNRNGNALFLILIAVALFAALSYAVTNSGRGGGGVDRETAVLQASEILQYGSSIATAITRMKIISGCQDTEISFHYDSNNDGDLDTDGSDDYYNPNSAGKTECYVFHRDGGGLNYKEAPTDLFSVTGLPKWGEQFAFSGIDCIPGVGSGADDNCWNNGTVNDTKLSMVMAGVSDELCRATNQLSGFQGDIPTMLNSNTNFYTETFPDGSFTGTFGSPTMGAGLSRHIITSENSTVGRLTSCFHYDGHFNILYYVVLAR